MRQMLWVDQLRQDLRYAVTLLTRDRGFTLVAALALALGIAATTSLITVVNAVILRGLPLADSDRLVAITMRDPRNRRLAMSCPDFDDWQRASRSFSRIYYWRVRFADRARSAFGSRWARTAGGSSGNCSSRACRSPPLAAC
jgi:hypothetical protein